MKLLKLIKEERTIKPYHKNIIKVMGRQGVSDEVSDMWDFLGSKLDIRNTEEKLEIMHLYKKYYGVEEEELDNLSDDDFSDMGDTSDIEDKKMALALNLDVPPMLLEEQSYTHYGLTVYNNLDDGSDYAVGDDSEVDKAMIEYFDNYVFNVGGIEYIDRWLLDDYIELDSYVVEEYARETAEYRVEDMDEDEVIEEAGYDKDSLESDLENLKDELSDLESEKEDLESELDDLEYDNDEGENDDEIEDLNERISDLEDSIYEKESEIEEKESEIESLYEVAKEELIDKMTEDISDDIESEGVDYFVDNMGYTLEQAVDSFCTFDESGLESYLAENEDRGNTLGSYDGVEEGEEYDGEWYYIYRVD
jgi:Skp family chaperone for outer membrane proteins